MFELGGGLDAALYFAATRSDGTDRQPASFSAFRPARGPDIWKAGNLSVLDQ